MTSARKSHKAPSRTARAPLPEIGASDRDVADFWDKHSAADYWQDLEPIAIENKSSPRQVITLRMDPKAAQALRALARRRGEKYSSLVRTWISERLSSELRTAAKAGRR